MRQLQLVPLVVHGALGYVLGVALVIAPFWLGFAGGSTEMTASVIAGVVTLLVTLVGSTPASAVGLLPLPVLEGIDYAIGLGLVLAPFLLDLTDDSTATLAYVLAGVTFFVVTLAARFPRKRAAQAGAASLPTIDEAATSNGRSADAVETPARGDDDAPAG